MFVNDWTCPRKHAHDALLETVLSSTRNPFCFLRDFANVATPQPYLKFTTFAQRFEKPNKLFMNCLRKTTIAGIGSSLHVACSYNVWHFADQGIFALHRRKMTLIYAFFLLTKVLMLK